MATCRRCGIEFGSESLVERYRETNQEFVCADCKRVPATVIKYKSGLGEDFCRPWHGDFDADDNPIDLFGRKFAGDVALCGHRDRVTQAHRPEMLPIRSVPKKKRSKYRASRKKGVMSLQLFLASAEARGQL